MNAVKRPLILRRMCRRLLNLTKEYSGILEMKDTLNGLGSDNGENIHRLLMKIIFSLHLPLRKGGDRCSRGYVN